MATSPPRWATAAESVPAVGERSSEDADGEASRGPESGTEDAATELHESISLRLRQSAARIDAFFSDESYEAELNRTRLRVRANLFKEAGDGVDPSADASLSLQLPGAERRWSLVITGQTASDDAPEDSNGDDSAQDFLTEGGDRGEAALIYQYLVRNVAISPQVGLKLNEFPLQAFAGTRLRWLVPIDTWSLRLTERLRWYTNDGFRSLSGLDLERPLGQRFFFRFSSEVDWREEEPGLTYEVGPTLIQQLDGRSYLAYDWNTDLETDPRHRVDQTRVRVRYRRQIWREWLILEVAPQVRWARENDFEYRPGLLLRLESVFGG